MINVDQVLAKLYEADRLLTLLIKQSGDNNTEGTMLWLLVNAQWDLDHSIDNLMEFHQQEERHLITVPSGEGRTLEGLTSFAAQPGGNGSNRETPPGPGCASYIVDPRD